MTRRKPKSNPRIQLRPDALVHAAVVELLRRYTHVMAANEEGVRAGEDCECLHDFRVAVRRCRSLLSAFADVVNDPDCDHIRAEFKWLNGVTGPRRDLDVFSHDLQAGGRFSELSAPTVDLLSRELATRWDDVQRQIVDCLNGRRYRVFRNEWQWFLYRVQHNVAHTAPARPIQPAADAAIWRVYRKLLRQGKRAAARGRIKDMHAARKTCKKLRYLIEALRSLYPVKRTRKAIDALQQMQTALGTVCDLAVQVRLVDGWRAVLLADHPEYPEVVLELTAMRDAIDACGKEAIATFGPNWRSFVAEPNRRLYRGLFKPETT